MTAFVTTYSSPTKIVARSMGAAVATAGEWRAKQDNAIVRFGKRLRQRKKLAGRAFGEPPLEIKRVRGW